MIKSIHTGVKIDASARMWQEEQAREISYISMGVPGCGELTPPPLLLQQRRPFGS
jgi:hypothetical protein